MTDTAHPATLDATSLYDWIAADEDDMSGFRKKFDRDRPFFLQMLNYGNILVTRERVQGVSESNGVTYVRFNDVKKDAPSFQFNANPKYLVIVTTLP